LSGNFDCAHTALASQYYIYIYTHTDGIKFVTGLKEEIVYKINMSMYSTR